MPSFPAGQGRLPVVWVSREDAAAYCRAQGARLPHEWEWQYAGQGAGSGSASGGGRPWPWGDEGDNETTGYTHRPNVSHAMTMPPPAAVDAYPSGASPFGVESMVGGVREWTDVYTDAHTSRAVLRGGSYWSPLPQPSVVYRYLFNYSSDIGYTDGAPNWYYPNPLVSSLTLTRCDSNFEYNNATRLARANWHLAFRACAECVLNVMCCGCCDVFCAGAG